METHTTLGPITSVKQFEKEIFELNAEFAVHCTGSSWCGEAFDTPRSYHYKPPARESLGTAAVAPRIPFSLTLRAAWISGIF
jgi:hypothetical protein